MKSIRTILMLLLCILVIIYYQENTDLILPYFLILILIYFSGCRNRKFDFFEPYNAIGVLHLLYATGSLSYVMENSSLPYGEHISSEVMSEFVVVTVISQLALSFGNILSYSLPFPGDKESKAVSYNENGYFSVILFFIIILLHHDSLNIFNVTSYADRVLDANVFKRSNSSSGIFDFFNIVSNVLIVYLALSFIFFRKHKLLKIFSIFILSLLALRFTLEGDRANMVMVLVSAMVCVNYKWFKLSLVPALLFSFFGYIVFNLMSIMRNYSNIAKMIEIGSEYYSNHGFKMFSLSRSGELIAGSNLMKVIKEVDENGTDFLYGGNFIDSLLTFIPRIIYPGEREGFGNERFVKLFYPETYAIGGGHGYYLPIDGYWELGVAGVFFMMLLYSFFATRIYFKFNYGDRGAFSIMIFSLFYSQGVIFAMRSGIYASFKQFLIYAFPLLILWFFKKIKIKSSW